MREIIDRWLKGNRNFTVGVILYEKYGTDDAILKQLKAAKNEYSQKLLATALQNVMEQTEQKKQPEVDSFIGEMPEVDDTILVAIKNEWMPLYTEMNYMRHQLDQYLEEESEGMEIKRAELARNILLIERKCIAAWDKRNYYVKHGRLPNIDPVNNAEVVVDDFMAAKRIENLKVYIRTYKNKLKKYPGNATNAALLKKYTEELELLNNSYGKN